MQCHPVMQPSPTMQPPPRPRMVMKRMMQMTSLQSPAPKSSTSCQLWALAYPSIPLHNPVLDSRAQVFLSALDASVMNTNYALIASEYHSLQLASWITTAYFLAFASGQPLYGKLSDVFGRKPCIIAAYTLFALGCLLCAVAQSMPQFLAARVVQGCGGAGVGTLVTVLLSDVIPLKDRAPWQGYFNLINAAGLGLGAPVGGLFADTVGWRWTFYVQVPLTALAVLSVVLFLHVPPPPAGDNPLPTREKLRRIDVLGATLLVSAIVALLLGLDRASALAWSHPFCYIPLALSPLFLLSFILVEAYVAADPIIAGAIIRARTPLAIYINNFFNYGAWSALVFYVPLFYQAVDGVSAAAAGLRLLPAVLCAVGGAVLGGYAIRGWGRYFPFLLVAGAATTLGIAPIILAMTEADVHPIAAVSAGLSINSFFYGVMSIVSLIALIAAVAAAEQATATATMFLSRSVGSAVAISLGGSLLQHVLQRCLHVELDGPMRSAEETERIVQGVRESLGFISTLAPELREVVRGCYADAVRAVMWAISGAFGAAWVASWWVVERKIK